MEIDWSKAPKDAEYFHPKVNGCSAHWVKPGAFCIVGYEYRGWTEDRHPGKDNSVLVKRPLDGGSVSPSLHIQQLGRGNRIPQWDGKGMPPVGAEVEVRYATDGFSAWHKATCIIRGKEPEGKEIFITQGEEGALASYRTTDYVRPFKTAEQIAAEEIQAIRDEIGYQRPQLGICPVEVMYKAGYRKP